MDPGETPLTTRWTSSLADEDAATPASAVGPVFVAMGVCLAIGLVLMTLTFFFIDRHLRQEFLFHGFRENALLQAAAVSDTLERHLQKVRDVAGLFAASGHISRGEFRAFHGRVVRGIDSLQALEWIPRVDADQRAAFEARAA